MRGPGSGRARVRGRLRGRHGDAGQVAIEFLGMTPTILVTLVVLWQLVLVGYTYTLAGNAADEAVRAGTAVAPGERAGACRAAGLAHLSDAWQGGAEVTCGGTGFVTADVSIEVPILFPGTVSFPFTVTGHAGAVEEEKD
ncbi:TadE/TadG family type IV pilus assembly protein [Streptomyces sp. NPDC052682]|uniref:TadE/TadG family type IV pilus assembly protein n=1 Tax=Streptomyces sp. NPDC052682 TaxID=3154954 RepID=UPI003422EF05